MAEEKRMEEVEVERKWRLEELWKIQEVEKDDEEDEDEWEAGPSKKWKYKEQVSDEVQWKRNGN